MSSKSLNNAIPIFLVLGSLYLFDNPSLSLAGLVLIILSLALLVLNVVREAAKFSLPLVLVLGLIVLGNAAALAVDTSPAAMRIFLVQLVVYLFILMVFTAKLDDDFVTMTKNVVLAMGLCLAPFVVLMIAAGGNDAHLRMFNTVFSFVIYKSLLPVYCVSALNNRYVLLKTALFVSLFYLIGERASAVCCIVFAVLYYLHGFIVKSKTISMLLFALFIVVVTAGPFIYVGLDGTALGIQINAISRELTGSNFFSGRNIIWAQSIADILANPIWGNGLNSRLMLGDGTLSLHNTFLTILYQGGMVGYALFISFLALIWKHVVHAAPDNPYARIAFASFGLLLCLGCFEVSLVQNSVNVSLLMWLIIAACSNYEPEETVRRKLL
ncbi:O-antigen ligase family protein [Gordonibacter urolithinfaciens]|uniref:O-antigen ligase family protein n=1 Tax=Gordonibacter urolithinfaciens TaxID=1335613 RepID=UPI003AABF449